MASAAKKQHFDALAFVKKSKAFGVKEELAEYQARSLEQVIDIAASNTQEEFNMRELATKMDVHEVRAEIKDLRTELKDGINALRVEIKDVRTELKSDMQTQKYDSLRFIVWTGVSVVVSLTGILGGLICKGFHWF